MQQSLSALLLLPCLICTTGASGQDPAVPARPAAAVEQPLCWIRTRDGADHEGRLVDAALLFKVQEETREVAVRNLLSLHLAAPPSATESDLIGNGLASLAGVDDQAAAAAVATLTDIGLPSLTPLLRSFADTDAHEPDRAYRLFERILPGHLDARDRTLDLVRLADGETFRGHWRAANLHLQELRGTALTVPAESVRWLAIRQAKVSRTFDLQALHHCTYVGFVDSGVAVTATSRLVVDAQGYVRLSFDEDGWATDPDGILEPLPGKRKLQEGFRWGALLGRTGPAGERWLAGRHLERGDLGTGRLHFAVNDNEHWQNNIGGFRVRLTATDAYDLGDAH